MALDWLNRIGPSKGEHLIEKAALIYTALTSIVIVVLFNQMDHPLKMLIERLCIVLCTFGCIFIYQKYPCKVTAFLRVGFQLSLLSYWYPDTYEFNRLLPNLDHLFAEAEQTIFGCQPAYWFQRDFPQLWISEPLNMGYFSYYPLIAAIVCWHFVKRFDLFEKIAFVIASSFFMYYIIYMILPVAGPQFYFPAIGEDNVLAGIFPSLGDYFNFHPELLPGAEHGQGFFYNLVGHLHYHHADRMEKQQEIGTLDVAFLCFALHCYSIYTSSLLDRCVCRMDFWLFALCTDKLDVQKTGVRQTLPKVLPKAFLRWERC